MRALCLALMPATVACGRVGFDAAHDAAQVVADGSGDGAVPGGIAGLVGWWKLDEGTGTIAADSSSYHLDGALTGATTWVVGPQGSALAFPGNGNDAEVDVPDEPWLELAASWSVAAWVNLTALPAASAYGTIVAKSTAGGYANYNLLVDNDHVSTGASWMIAYNAATCGVANAKSPSAPTLGAWTHVASVYDATAGTLVLYIAGVVADSEPVTTCPPNHTGSGEDLSIGTEYGGGVTQLDGAVYDVRVFDRALSDTEIEMIVAGG